jgi:hypothetical protein
MDADGGPLGRLPRGGDRARRLGQPRGGTHRAQRRQFGVHRVPRLGGGHLGLTGGAQTRHGGLHRGGQLPHPVQVGGGLLDGLVGGILQAAELLLDHGQLGLRAFTPLGRLDLHLLVDVQAQEVDQDLLPGRRFRVQEVGELTLRQHHATGELLVGQTHRVQHGGVHLGRGAGQHLAQILQIHPGVELRDVEAGRHQLQPGTGGLHIAPAVAADHPRRHEPVAGRLEHQAHPGLGGRRREGVADPPHPTPSRNGAVEGETDRVENGRLARTGRADQGEVVGVGEVHGRLVTEDREPGHVEPQWPHWLLLTSS